jgi:hypothetical protein
MRAAAARVGKRQQFDQVFVHRRRGRLQEEDVLATNGFQKFHRDFAVREPADGARAEPHAQCAPDRGSQVPVGRPREDHKSTAHGGLDGGAPTHA